MSAQAKLARGIVGLPQTGWRYVRESRDELRKVSWPSRQTTVRYTLLVIAASVVVGVVTGGFDWVLTKVLEQVI